MQVVPLVTGLAIGAAALGGCSDQGVCTADIRLAVEVEVLEAGTEQFLSGLARGVLRDGTFEDSLRIFGVRGSDLLTYAAVIALFAVITLMACYLPARRATRVDPVEALRWDG